MRISELSTAWLAAALKVGPSRVTDLESDPAGTGQVADTYRLSFQLDGTAQSLVLKLTSDDLTSRETGRVQANYLREVRFYQELAPTVAVRVPQCRHADVDDTGTEFDLLLEDMTPCGQVDQLTGCTVAEVEAVLDEAARLHGPRWQDPAITQLPWLSVNAAARRPGPDIFTAMFAGFRERYADRIEDEVLAVGEKFFPHIGVHHKAQQAAPQTVTHGDFRPDNILFGGQGGQVPVTVVDWQTVDAGAPLCDVSYFVGGALCTEDRRAHERPLLERYYEGLRCHGVTGYSFTDCWQDYGRFALQNYVVGVGAAMSVKQTERGDAMFISMVRSGGYHAIDLDTLGLLGVG
jgi:aminoglycoside/choline kinase family phosphotransferase